MSQSHHLWRLCAPGPQDKHLLSAIPTDPALPNSRQSQSHLDEDHGAQYPLLRTLPGSRQSPTHFDQGHPDQHLLLRTPTALIPLNGRFQNHFDQDNQDNQG
jgi:hypothetical protein